MKRKIVIALPVITAAAIALLIRTGEPTVDEIGVGEGPAGFRSKTEVVNSANEAPIVDAPVADDEGARLEEERADVDDAVVESPHTNSAIALSVESQEFVRVFVYEVLAAPEISSVAYLQNIECGHSGCGIEVTFYDAFGMNQRTASLMSDMNTRLHENPSTKHLQFSLTSIKRGDDGLGKVVYEMMPKPERQFDINIMLGDDTRNSGS